jgi:hypothetical protein
MADDVDWQSIVHVVLAILGNPDRRFLLPTGIVRLVVQLPNVLHKMHPGDERLDFPGSSFFHDNKIAFHRTSRACERIVDTDCVISRRDGLIADPTANLDSELLHPLQILA